MTSWLQRIEAHHKRLIWMIVLAGTLLRLQGLGWDGWLQLHPDERNLVDATLALSFPDRMIPDFHAYNGLALYLPRALAWLVYGPAPDAAALTWAARAVSACFGSAAILVGALVALRLAGPLAGVAAALLLASSGPLLQWAHFGTTESAMVLSVLLFWWLALRSERLQDPPLRTALISGLVLGLALGMKSTAAAFAMFPLIAMGLAWSVWGRAVLPASLAGAALACVLFLASTPSLLLATSDYLQVMTFEAGVVAGTADVFWTLQFDGATNGLYEVAALWRLLDGGVLILALIGAVIGVRTDPRAVLPALAFSAVYCAIIFLWYAKFTRYLAPFLPILLIFAAIAVARIMQMRSLSAMVATAAAICLSVVTGLALAVSYQATDPRTAASDFLRQQLRDGDMILREPFDIGAPQFDWPTVEHLPLLDPTGPAKLDEIARMVARADWLVINSRRHWQVLPRLHQRYPLMCGYYAALKAGDFGLSEVARFVRAEPLHGLLGAGLAAEETRVVFDRPEVVVLRRIETKPVSDIVIAITAQGGACQRVEF